MKNRPSDTALAFRKRRITGRGLNPFRKGSFHNDVTPKPSRKNFALAREMMDNYVLPEDEIPNLRGRIQECCNKALQK